MERAKVFKLFLTSIHKTITSWNHHSKNSSFRLSESWESLSWLGASKIQESLPLCPKIVSNYSDSVGLDKYSFKLKYGKILYEEDSKQEGEFEVSLLEEQIAILRDRRLNESRLANLNAIVEGWITYDFKKKGVDLLEVWNDDNKMREAFLQIGKAKNDQMVLEREEARKAREDARKSKSKNKSIADVSDGNDDESDGNDDESDVGESSSVGKEG